ncbi:hypothetical protein VM1G_09262 [Cytospora mali]|uniref:Uncharacterized protein n=1 Tax=Cytospora mali TaxID=578113 RepID=A0A194WBQ3_CYTMA|nr:hypothetical protein VM1G_09262 [Valsa mali]
MAANSKWNDSSVKDLTFAVLMSANDGSVNVKANWDKVELFMKAWGYDFTKGAMSQQWTKKVLKEFRQRHPDAAGHGDGNSSAPATPASKSGCSRGPRTPKTPASGKGKVKGKKRAVDDDDDDDDEDTSPPGNFIADAIANNRTPRRSAKKIKYEDDAVEDEAEVDEDNHENVDVQPRPKEEDEDYEFLV